MTPDASRKDDYQTPTKGGKGKDKLGEGKGKDKRKSSAKSRMGRRSSLTSSPPPPGAATPASETEGRSVLHCYNVTSVLHSISK